ncbi:magnesium transporter MgtC [Salipaludibacillus keqinensis]|jgi:putative Mg2+ transporter-C (MgtC) family protein|uniref:Magnesium transporter MgtC n=2 Tax=Salipaludibacillus keqinensis TaxID=2045207 RepID=A0A323T8T5_9BACI|nr:magnesium transporter MgtC [Salipaludibacillus keqinensis]
MVENDIVIMVVRLVLAAILGGFIGLERELHHHPAGFRTHLLVSVGSSLIMLLAFYGFQDYIAENKEVVTFDPSRLAAYVVSGIGFLGAGTILVQGYTVRGLTTAASIWVVAGIGLTVGAGMYSAAIIATVIVVLSLFLLGKVTFRFGTRERKNELSIFVDEQGSQLNELIKIFETHAIKIHSMKSEKQNIYNENPMIEYRLVVEYIEETSLRIAVDALHKISFVKKVAIEKESNETTHI